MIDPPAVAVATPDPLDRWPAFMRAVETRLEQGRAEYGARSFTRDPADLLGELQEEVLDLAGWGFVLWHRLEEMREQLDGFTRPEAWADGD